MQVLRQGREVGGEAYRFFFARDAFRRRQADGLGPQVTCVRWVEESARSEKHRTNSCDGKPSQHTWAARKFAALRGPTCRTPWWAPGIGGETNCCVHEFGAWHRAPFVNRHVFLTQMATWISCVDGHVVLLVVVRTAPFPDEWPPILPISRCAINQPCVDVQEMNPYFVVCV